MTGPRPSSRPRTISTSASSRVQAFARIPRARLIGGLEHARRDARHWNSGRRSAAIHEALDALQLDRQGHARFASRASSRGELCEHAAPSPGWRATSCCSDVTQPQQRIVQLVRDSRPAGQASSRTRAMASGSSRPISAALSGIEPAAADHRLRAALFQRRVVEEGIGPRAQNLERQRRGRRSGRAPVTRTSPLSSARSRRSSPSMSIASMQAVVDGLAAPADGRESRDRRRCSPGRRAGRGTRPRSSPRLPCAAAAAAPCCRP